MQAGLEATPRVHLNTFLDILKYEYERAMDEMESAMEINSILRAQGAAQVMRTLIADVEKSSTK